MQLVAQAEVDNYPGTLPLGYQDAIDSLGVNHAAANPCFTAGEIAVGQGDDAGTGSLERLAKYDGAKGLYIQGGTESLTVRDDAEALCATIQDMREQVELDYCTWLSQQ